MKDIFFNRENAVVPNSQIPASRRSVARFQISIGFVAVVLLIANRTKIFLSEVLLKMNNK